MIQEEYFGIGSIDRLKIILNKEKPDYIFLVTGKDSYTSSGAREKIESLLFSYPHIRFSDFSSNPKIEDVEKGIELYKKENSDLIIAVGGGSVIDMAKAINILSHQSRFPKDYVLGNQFIEKSGKPLIAIPTTSGTGSESTQFLVIYINKKKYSLDHPFILPTYSLIDPVLTYNLSPIQTAISGMDALTQAVESYWSVRSTEESKRYAGEAIRLAIKNLENSVNSPTMESRVAMARSSNLSGKAINISRTTACHALSYPLTSIFGIPHGHAVSLTLGDFLDYNYNVLAKDCSDMRGEEYVRLIMKEICSFLGKESIEESISIIYSLMHSIGLSGSLKETGIPKEKIFKAFLGLDLTRARNNPRLLTSSEVKKIIKLDFSSS